MDGRPVKIDIGIGFGSNMGDRLANLIKARRLLLDACDDPDRAIFSAVYETLPVDCAAETNLFYNAVGQFTFSNTPQSILELCLQIESLLGRSNLHETNAPRTIDLDLLYAGKIVTETHQLTIPHPRLTSRLFVLIPLAEIRPELQLPGDRFSVTDHLKSLSLPTLKFPIVTKDWQ